MVGWPRNIINLFSVQWLNGFTATNDNTFQGPFPFDPTTVEETGATALGVSVPDLERIVIPAGAEISTVYANVQLITTEPGGPHTFDGADYEARIEFSGETPSTEYTEGFTGGVAADTQLGVINFPDLTPIMSFPSGGYVGGLFIKNDGPFDTVEISLATLNIVWAYA